MAVSSSDENKARMRALLLELRAESGLTYDELAKRLADNGVDISPRVLNNRLNRGNFTAGFALTVLQVFGVTTLNLTKHPARLRVEK